MKSLHPITHYSVPGLPKEYGHFTDLSWARHTAERVAYETQSPSVILVHMNADGREVIELYEIVTMKR